MIFIIANNFHFLLLNRNNVLLRKIWFDQRYDIFSVIIDNVVNSGGYRYSGMEC